MVSYIKMLKCYNIFVVVWAVLHVSWPASVVVIELWAVETFLCYAFYLCLFFVASVVYVV
jgi:hypothetical protein